MHNVLMVLQVTPIPLAICLSGMACLILAIVSEIPPIEGEQRLLVPRWQVPTTGIILTGLGTALLIL